MKETTTPQILRKAVSMCMAVAAFSQPGLRAHAQSAEDAAQAADRGQDLHEVVVTGTHLRRSTNTHMSSPVQAIDREELLTTPRATLGDFVVESTINSGSFSSGEKTSQSDATATP